MGSIPIVGTIYRSRGEVVIILGSYPGVAVQIWREQPFIVYLLKFGWRGHPAKVLGRFSDA